MPAVTGCPNHYTICAYLTGWSAVHGHLRKGSVWDGEESMGGCCEGEGQRWTVFVYMC